MPQLVILADDLTGAAFAAVGLGTVISLSDTTVPHANVTVVSTESRDLDGTAAAEAPRSALTAIGADQGDAGPRWISN